MGFQDTEVVFPSIRSTGSRGPRLVVAQEGEPEYPPKERMPPIIMSDIPSSATALENQPSHLGERVSALTSLSRIILPSTSC